MATKKKSAKAKRFAGSKAAPAKRHAPKPKTLKSSASRVAAPKAAAKRKSLKKATAGKKSRNQSQPDARYSFSPEASRSRPGLQSGDLQGLSGIESADSESVDELMEVGNAFEADVVAGVERAGDDNDEKEVHTHEVPEDDVPEEYLDKE
jgi:hypothetical protein